MKLLLDTFSHSCIHLYKAARYWAIEDYWFVSFLLLVTT